MLKFVCDRCGKETGGHLEIVTINSENPPADASCCPDNQQHEGDFCLDCYRQIRRCFKQKEI